MYTSHDVFVPYVHLPGPMSLDHMHTYQDLRHWIIHVLTRTHVIGSHACLPGPMSFMYTVLTRTYVLGSYVYLPGPISLDHMYTYQDLCPWIICILTRTHVLGSYVYLPGPTYLDHVYTCQDLRIWIMCILTRTFVFGSYVYLPGPRSLEKTTDKQAQNRLTHRQRIMRRSMYRQVEIEVNRCWIQK